MRTIICADAMDWLRRQRDQSIGNVITGICDLDEMPGQTSLEDYRRFFFEIAKLIMKKVRPENYAIFIQTDRKYQGTWVDKSHWLNQCAESVASELKWHRICLTRDVGSTDLHRPTFSHMMCFSRVGRPGAAFPDVLPVGHKRLYKNATSLVAADYAVRFVKENARDPTIIDPFCGRGTIPAVANAYGCPAVGIDIDPDQCAQSQKLAL
ncbi:MAG: hypothetical protein ACYCOU_01615 [Sulfobacillus sp.]